MKPRAAIVPNVLSVGSVPDNRRRVWYLVQGRFASENAFNVISGVQGNAMRARLVAAEGGQSIELKKDMTLFGRDEDCDVRLDHKSVSKLHCVIVKTDGVLLLRDLGSTNGTRVNGQRVRRAALLPNDTLFIANVKYTVQFGVELEKAEAEEAKEQGKDKQKKDAAAALRRNVLPDVYPSEAKPKG